MAREGKDTKRESTRRSERSKSSDDDLVVRGTGGRPRTQGTDLLDRRGTKDLEEPDRGNDDFMGKNLDRQLDIHNVVGLIECVTTVPTHIPKSMFDQIKIYESGATKRLYVYNYKVPGWRYATI
jgi:hypothetical protein